MIHEPRHCVSVAAAVVDEQGRMLATRRRDNGNWEPPGGVLEIDESIEEGLVREVREETGLVVEAEVLSGVYKNMTLGVVALVFRCRVVGGQASPSDEVLSVAWLTTDEIRERMAEAYAVRMIDAMATDGPKIRTHDGVGLPDN